MLKKFLNVFICIGLLFQYFAFLIPARALENQAVKFKIISLKQGDKELVLQDGKYVIDGYDKVFITYELENYDNSKNYEIKMESFTYDGAYVGGQGYGYYGKSTYELDFHNNYKLSVCNNYDCDIKYDSINITFDNKLYESINKSYVFIENIYQGGKNIIPNNIEDYSKTAYYNFNDLEKITYKIKGVNLQSDAHYDLHVDMSSTYDIGTNILGSDLNDGYEFSFYPTFTQPSRFILTRGDYNVGYILYNNNNEYLNIYNHYNADSNLKDFDVNIIYTNYQNISINETLEFVPNAYLIHSKYHNVNDTLSIQLSGNDNFQNQNYDIKIEGYSNNIKTYDKTFSKNGLDISGGIKLELEQYLLSYITEYNLFEPINKIYITIGDIKKEIKMHYTSSDKMPRIDSNIYYENGKKNLSTFRGNGGINWEGGIADTNKNAFIKYSSMYFNFTGTDFNDKETYDYIFEYGSYNDVYSENVNDNYKDYQVLDRGKISGRVLNTIGMNFKVHNAKNYKMPFYRFVIKKGDEIIYYQVPVISLVNSPTLANVSMTSNNKNLYLQTDDMSYISTRNHPLNVVISGLGFQEDKNYEFNYCYQYDEDYQNEVCEKISINGKDLNNGTGSAKLKFNKKIPSSVSKINFYVYSEPDANQFNENVAIQGGFQVTLVDSKDYFPTLSKYILDNDGDFIKNISKLTNVKDFTSTINISNNGKVKIFDSTGQNEVKDTIGTGMIARIINEYDENVLDVDVVVKGDVSGDGNISITDLVKVKRHLSKDDVLTGVYEVAGNVSDTGKIGITDLVKISRDVAKIQEVQ